MPLPEQDPLEVLREQIRATHEAAEALAGEASHARDAQDPPAGWATPGDHADRTDEVRALASLLETIRELIPDDLADQFRDLVRQVLLLLRALIDWWVQRMESVPGPAAATGPAVQDIPIA